MTDVEFHIEIVLSDQSRIVFNVGFDLAQTINENLSQAISQYYTVEAFERNTIVCIDGNPSIVLPIEKIMYYTMQKVE